MYSGFSRYEYFSQKSVEEIMRKKIFFILGFSFIIIHSAVACTTIMVGKKASKDSSVIVAYASDSRTSRTWFNIIPHRKYKNGSQCAVYKNTKRTKSPTDLSAAIFIGNIPQVPETYQYINTSYPLMNENQLMIGESTFGGRDTLRNKKAMFTIEELCRLAQERAKTAREAIRIIDELTKEYGYSDSGEHLAIGDKNEIWVLEILGCGHDKIGAVWAAQRVPDDHVCIGANGSRIRQIDLNNPDYFMASDNVFDIAIKYGWWDPHSGKPFEFCYAYAPKTRTSLATRRREWRVLDLLAQSLGLDPNSENYPFSVKPDSLVSVRKIMEIMRDTFEGTPFDMTKYMLVKDKNGKAVKSPYANPFMHYDMMPLFKINGGWNELGERCIARYYCNFVFVAQARDWMPDPIGGLVWFGYDNPAMTAYAPIYIGIKDVPDSYKINGRSGFNRDCAWWAFNRVADLAAQKWGLMRIDVDSVRAIVENKAFSQQHGIENKALILYKKSPKKALKFLTNYSNEFMNMIVEQWWKLGDFLWSKYTGKF